MQANEHVTRTRVFRRHWLAFVRPGWWVLPVTIGIVLLAASLPRGELALLLLAFPALRWFSLCADWLAFSLSLTSGAKEVVETSGIIFMRVRRIPLTFFGNVAFEQSWLDRRLDRGTASVAAIGGPYEWRAIASFGDLRTALESRGEIVPLARPPRVVLIARGLAVYTQRLSREAIRALGVAADRARANLRRRRRRPAVAARPFARRQSSEPLYRPPSTVVQMNDLDGNPSYDRFLSFVEHFVFDEGDWRPETYARPDWRRCHFRSGVSGVEANQYLSVLRQCRIIQCGPQGRESLATRIHTLADVRLRVPDVWNGHRNGRTIRHGHGNCRA